MIPVTKPFLPSRKLFDQYVDQIYSSACLTNHGPLVQELEKRLAAFFGLEPENIVLVSNGSMALHLSYKALDLAGEVITTPFTFVATSSSLAWEGLKPIYADIDDQTWNINPKSILAAITKNTSAIVPVHVFGNPCDIKEIERIAQYNELDVIYDASHCFGVNYEGRSVLKYGNISTISFHATKLFHTVEGGAVIARDVGIAKKIRSMINFGVTCQEKPSFSTNCKMSELHAGMGLAVLDEIDVALASRAKVWELYDEQLGVIGGLQKRTDGSNNNYSYFPILLDSESDVHKVLKAMALKDIHARRYFFPSLDTIYLEGGVCPISRDISNRVLCLPLFPGMSLDDAALITAIVKKEVGLS